MADLLRVYLAGAIRDGHPEDIQWRESVCDKLAKKVCILNPLGGKTYNPRTRRWSLHGVSPTGELILAHDFWMVDHCDILIANFLSLREGYPSIGTLVEWGRATARPVLRYAILPSGYRGHENQQVTEPHPFIAKTAAAVFDDVDHCLDFLGDHLDVLSGAKPRFGGTLL